MPVNIDQWFQDSLPPSPKRWATPFTSTPIPMARYIVEPDLTLPPWIFPVKLAAWLSVSEPVSPPLRARSLPNMSPAPSGRGVTVKVAATIVQTDLTLTQALDPEVIRLDKWLPLLPDFHR